METDLQKMLSAPFEDADIEWRLQYANEEKGSGVAVPYVTNRAIQNRLDRTVGISNWKNEFIPWHGDGKKQAQLCGISIYFPERGEWITKFDGAEDSDIEAVKGGLSDSMKRAAVQWGIGRYLYEMDTVYVDIEKPGKTVIIAAKSKPKLSDAHGKVINRIFGAAKPQGSDGAPPGGKTAPQTATKPTQADKPPAPPPVQTDKTPAPQPNPASGKPGTQPAPQNSSPATKPAPAKEPVAQPVGKAPPGHATATAMPQKNKYRVIDVARQASVRGANTNLRLECLDGGTVMAYMQGENPALVKGSVIENAVITKKISDGIVFYTLDSFDMALQNAA